LTGAPWTGAQTRAQFAAIAKLRFIIFRNGLRRKGGRGDFIANLVMVPLFLLFTIGPSVGAGFIGYFAVAQQQPTLLLAALWGIFILCQLVGVQLGQPGTTFDPTQLIRFPLGFPQYAAVRVFFGLISPSNLLACLMSFALALGVSVADSSLAVWAFGALAVYAAANVFFTRMLFSWVDRWLSTRRAREVFTGIIFAGALGIQYLNFTFNPGFQHGHHQTEANLRHLHQAQSAYAAVSPYLGVLPPALVARALHAAKAGAASSAAFCIAGVLLYAAVFLAVFAFRMFREFRGENLSDVANAVSAAPVRRAAVTAPAALAAASPASHAAPRFSTPPTVAAVVAKEFLTLRRNTGVFYSLVGPLVMVVLFISKLATHTPVYYLFPGAVAYTLLGIAPLAFNSLGIEAAGVQFYFLAPVRMRDVMFAKNLLQFALAAIEIIAVFLTITLSVHAPSPAMTIVVLLWAAFTMLISMAVGNHRSIVAPKKIDPNKTLNNKQASPLSALLSMGILLLSAGVGASFMLLSRAFSMPWLLPPIALVLAVTGALVYRYSLNATDKTFAEHRDTLSEVLCKGA
jgi:ABC-2 type transport system permease protein